MLTKEQRIFNVQKFYRYRSSIGKCLRSFRRKFPGVITPARSTVHRLIKKFEDTGSVLDREKSGRNTILSETKLDEKVPIHTLQHIGCDISNCNTDIFLEINYCSGIIFINL